MPFAAQARPLHQRHRRQVAHVDQRHHPVQVQRLEAPPQQRPQGLRGVALPLPARRQRDANFGQARLVGMQVQGTVAQQFIVGGTGNAQLHPLAGRGRHGRHGVLGNKSRGLFRTKRVEALEAAHGRVGPVGGEGC